MEYLVNLLKELLFMQANKPSNVKKKAFYELKSRERKKIIKKAVIEGAKLQVEVAKGSKVFQ
jgi:hypothetical protein